MQISAHVDSSRDGHAVEVATDGTVRTIVIPAKPQGGSSANGGELLCLALATCYCNDLYREAGKRGVRVDRVEVRVEAAFAGEGMPAEHIAYRAKVAAAAPHEDIVALMRHTDTVAEVQNTLRRGCDVVLVGVEAVCV
jgi:organic hydroperoxide reductase OsmC/OhrA